MRSRWPTFQSSRNPHQYRFSGSESRVAQDHDRRVVLCLVVLEHVKTSLEAKPNSQPSISARFQWPFSGRACWTERPSCLICFQRRRFSGFSIRLSVVVIESELWVAADCWRVSASRGEGRCQDRQSPEPDIAMPWLNCARGTRSYPCPSPACDPGLQAASNHQLGKRSWSSIVYISSLRFLWSLLLAHFPRCCSAFDERDRVVRRRSNAPITVLRSFGDHPSDASRATS